jgi:molybdate transport system substrate-binding protein
VPTFEDAFPGIHVVVDYGPGAEHALHIIAGAPVDVFVSADAGATGQLTAQTRGTPTVIARNPIVIAVPTAAATRGIADLRGARVALCAETPL